MENNCVTKKDIVDALVEGKLGIDRDVCLQTLENFLELIKYGLERDGKVLITHFGSFEVQEKKPRKGINPQNLEPIILRGRRVVKFKPSSMLKRSLNE